MKTWLLYVVIAASPVEPPTVITLDFGDKVGACAAMERTINIASGKTQGDQRLYAWCYKGKKP